MSLNWVPNLPVIQLELLIKIERLRKNWIWVKSIVRKRNSKTKRKLKKFHKIFNKKEEKLKTQIWLKFKIILIIKVNMENPIWIINKIS
jgi:hypothetical protein